MVIKIDLKALLSFLPRPKLGSQFKKEEEEDIAHLQEPNNDSSPIMIHALVLHEVIQVNL